MLEYYADLKDTSTSVNLTVNNFQRTLPFYMVSCGEFFTNDKYFTRRDGLNNYLLIVTTGGLGKMIWKEQTCYLKPGSAVVIDCNLYQDYKTEKDNTWDFYYIHFNALSIEGYRNILMENLTAVQLLNFEHVCDLMKKLHHLSSGQDSKTHIIVSNTISEILTQMVCSLSETTVHNTSVKHDVNRLQEFINENFSNELHINDFMKHINLSRYYLIHTFKKQIGISPYQYMHMCRINYSQTLLSETEMTIAEIAEKAGYNSAAVFIRHFKAFNKITPKKYRLILLNIP